MKIEEAIQQKKFKNEYQKAGINITFTAKWLEHKHVCMLKPYKISPQQYNILRILRGQHPKCASIKSLQDKMMDKMSNASRLVEKLRLKELVDRRYDKEDRRLVRVTITDKGLDMLKEIDIKMDGLEEEFKVLSVQEAEMLNNLLDKLRS